MPAELADQATADAFLRRQLVLTWVAGLVAFTTMAVVALSLHFLPASSTSWVVATAAAGSVAVAVVLVVLVGHVVRLAAFVFRKELR